MKKKKVMLFTGKAHKDSPLHGRPQSVPLAFTHAVAELREVRDSWDMQASVRMLTQCGNITTGDDWRGRRPAAWQDRLEQGVGSAARARRPPSEEARRDARSLYDFTSPRESGLSEERAVSWRQAADPAQGVWAGGLQERGRKRARSFVPTRAALGYRRQAGDVYA